MPIDPAGRRVTAPVLPNRNGTPAGQPQVPGGAPAPLRVADGWDDAPKASWRVNTTNPTLQSLASGRLVNGADGTCVATTRTNMERMGVPGFSATSSDPNNARGAMVELLKGGDWASVPLGDAQLKTIRSPYGTVQAYVMSPGSYERLAQNGEVPSGALIFQTRHGWDYGGGAHGNDMGIVRDGGRTTHNYQDMSPIIYPDAREVVLLVPKDALVQTP